MKILILGVGSFAGQSLFSNYLKNGVDVYGINRSEPKDEYYWPWIKDRRKDIEHRWFKYSLTQNLEDMIEKIGQLKPQIIIDFMGQGMVAQSWANPDLWYLTNITNKSKLINSIQKSNTLEKYIRISTPEVYGSNEKYLTETNSFNPSTPYAVSHAAIDMHLRCLYKEKSFPYMIGRFANFYGIGQQLYRVIPRLFLSCKTNKKFILDGKGSSRRSFIFSDDIISAINAMIKFGTIGEEYNFSSNEELSILELVEKICELNFINKSEIINYGPERPGKDKFYRLNIDKAENELNWVPQVFLNEGLKKVSNWIEKYTEELSNESWNYIHKT